jgi:hypothetical protein
MSVAQEDAAAAARQLARARWGDRVLRRSAATVLERPDGRLGDTTRAELEQIAGDPADGDDAA